MGVVPEGGVRRASTQALLFTDIEGSTKLLERLGGGYPAVLERHHELVRDAIAEFGGTEQGTDGDALFVTFDSSSDALAAAVSAQRSLGSEPWPLGGTIRVRMGVHVGEVSATAAGLVGIAIHHAARIAATGHGGQIVVSDTVRAFAVPLPDGVGLVSLGRHAIRDVGVTELHQVTHRELEAQFPPLRATPAVLGNLTAQPSSLVGRAAEIAEIATLVQHSRLVTLTGAGGSGKTRLACEVAAAIIDRFDDGVWVVELAPLVDPGSVASAVVAALGLKADPDRPDVDVLVDVLSDRTELLVLDNCEHVLDAAASLAGRLIHDCPDVSLVATSREALNVVGETVYRVPSLACPAAEASTDEIAEFEAVRLFLRRAHDRGVAIESDVEHLNAVAEICRRLDGMPLAIELAAARTTAMSVQQLHDQLSDRFRLLTGGSRSVLPRQQTLRALIDWSYDALSARDQDVLCLLAVFSGGLHLSEGQAALGRSGIDAWDSFDAIASLVDKNLIQADETARGMRYWLLETVRQYATERMIDRGADAMQAAREAHLDVFVELATTARPELLKSDQRSWLRRLEAEVDNFRSALTFGMEQSSTRERCARLADAVMRLHWRVGVLSAELNHVHTRLTSDPEVPDDLRVDLLGNLGALVSATSTEIAGVHAAAAVSLARQLGDKRRIAERTLLLAQLELVKGHVESTLALAAEAGDIARSVGDDFIVTCAQAVAGAAICEEEPLRSQQVLEACAAYFTAMEDYFNRGVALLNLGVGELAAGCFETARSYLDASQAALVESGASTLSEGPYDLGLADYGLGDIGAARINFAEAIRIDLASGDWRRVGFDLLAAALIATRDDRFDDAATLHAAADCVMQAVGASFESFLQRWQESDMAEIMIQVGEQAVEVARVAGQHLSRSEAVALARTVLTDLRC